MKKSFLGLIIGVVASGVLGVVSIYNALTTVDVVFDEVTYELGNVVIDEDITSYITTSEYMLNKASLDISGIDVNSVGDYEALITIDDIEYTYNIHIVDTTAPEITFGEINTVFGSYNTYNLENLNLSVSDISEIENVEIISCSSNDNNLEVTNNSVTFDDSGIYTITVKSADIYGNEATSSIDVEVVDAPHFELLYDRRYEEGTYLTPSDLVFAQDRFGNDISDRVVILSDGNYNPDVAGDYTVTYQVVDDDNLCREETININIGNDYSFGFSVTNNMDYLVEHDYFTYESLSSDDASVDDVVALTSPTSFDVIECDEENSESYRYSFSAFIYEITPDYIFFFTSKHCPFDYSYVYFRDFNENIIYVPNSAIRTIAYRPEYNFFGNFAYDVRVFAVPTYYFTAEEIMTYREVNIDWNVYDNLETGDLCVVNTQSFRGANDRISELTVCAFDEDFATSHHNGRVALYFNETPTIPGQSGSPTFDIHGNLVSIVSGSSPDSNTNVRRDFGTSIEIIHDFLTSSEYYEFYYGLVNA